MDAHSLRGVGSGAITEEYRGALRRHDLKAFFPLDASVQPGQLQEVMLHETAVSWMRDELTKTPPQEMLGGNSRGLPRPPEGLRGADQRRLRRREPLPRAAVEVRGAQPP